MVDGIRFASKKEARRYQELRLLEKAGLIRDLNLQVRLPLACSSGEVAAHYVADFTYLDRTRGVVVEDAKGCRTQTYALKRRWFAAEYAPLTITEV
jgi:hypothetical protein